MTATTRPPFQTKGDRPEWQIVYDHLRTLNVGDTVTYATLDRLLDRDFIPDRSPIYRAMKQLEENDKRTLDNVPNVGYRVVAPNEHEFLARRHHQRSKRQMKKALRKAKSADRNKMTADERTRIDAIELNVSRQADQIRYLSIRQTKTERALRVTTADQAATAAQVEKLTAALQRHGITVDD